MENFRVVNGSKLSFSNLSKFDLEKVPHQFLFKSILIWYKYLITCYFIATFPD